MGVTLALDQHTVVPQPLCKRIAPRWPEGLVRATVSCAVSTSGALVELYVKRADLAHEPTAPPTARWPCLLDAHAPAEPLELPKVEARVRAAPQRRALAQRVAQRGEVVPPQHRARHRPVPPAAQVARPVRLRCGCLCRNVRGPSRYPCGAQQRFPRGRMKFIALIAL